MHRNVISRFIGSGSLFALVAVTGFFTAGTNAGISCSTFPWVGQDWFYGSKHFISDIPLWQNFTENKLICQVNHRTLALIMTIAVTIGSYSLIYLRHLTPSARLSLILLTSSLWVQLFIGMNVIWKHVPINLASMHQIGAMTVLSCFLFSAHCSRKIDPRHMRNMMGKLRIENKPEFDRMFTKMA